MESETLNESPLREAHLRHGARMVPFAGWNMPVQFAGITAEHHAVRNGCGVFDISHMGEFFVTGPGARTWLNSLLTNNTAKLSPAQGQYTLMLNDTGGVIDDLIVYCVATDRWFLVVNASMIDEDRAWMQAHQTAGVELLDESAGWAGMAVQGPNARDIAAGAGLPSLPPRNGIAEFDGGIICRTGYTGEDGFEFFCPASEGVRWLERFIAAGAVPCGLGARDTLRLEMGFPLNGNDLSPTRTPLEAGLGVFVDLEKGPFPGRGTLLAQKRDGLPSKLCGVRVADKSPPPRAHYPVLHAGRRVGELCSGGVSPSLGCGIGMAYLPPALTDQGTVVEIEIRGKAWPATVVKKPFYRRPAAG